MKRFSLTFRMVVLATLSALLLSACAAKPPAEPTTTPADPAKPAAPTAPARTPSKFPTGPVRLVVPFSAGGGYDTQGRGIAPFLEKHLPGNFPVIVENKGGAGGTLGAHAVWNAKPDGHTILLSSSLGLAMSQAQRPEEIKYDVSKFEWLGSYMADVRAWGIRSDLNINSWDELMARAKETPIIFGASGLGNNMYYEPAIVAKNLGLPVDFVHYGGSNEAMAGMARGEIEMVSLGAASLVKFANQGDVKFLFIWDKERFSLVPETPSAVEFGISEADFDAVPPVIGGYRALSAPPGTPAEVVKVLRTAFEKALNDPEYDAYLKKSNSYKTVISGEKFQGIVENMLKRMIEVAPLMKELMGQ